MTSSGGLASRTRSAYAVKAAAKQRRQQRIAIVGFVLLVIVGAYEIPKLISRASHQSTPAPLAAPVPPPAARTLPKAFRGPATSDPFAASSLQSDDSQVAPAGPGHDPFASPGEEAAPTSTPAVTQPLPQTIVIGTPGGNRVAVHGWIVILASIPTREGRSSALSFARLARQRGLGSVSVLNSSNRRPLRGGYWVVYTGPYPTLSVVTQRASSVHGSGYGSAYIRQLIIYR
jgi:hypothetical protein